MAAIPFALSVSHFVNSVGAKAGFAAIIGLAILVLLFFAQARETATLRDRADESEAYVRQLELRMAQLARGAAPGPTGTPAPAPPPVGVQRSPAAPAVAAAAAPPASRVVPPPVTTPPSAAPLGAPAGVGAPALNAATRLIPGMEAGAISIRATGAAAPASTAAAGAAPAARAVGGSASAGPPAGPPSTGAAVMTPPSPAPGPAPSTAAGGANGGSGTRVPPPAPAPVPAPPPASVRPAPPPPRGQIRPAAPRPSSGGPRRLSPDPGRSRISGTALVIAGLLAVAAVVVVLLLVTSGGSSTSSSSSSSATGNTASGKHHRSGRSHALTPSAITVSVLNGTSTPNLARAVSNRLGSSGYKPGRVTNAVDQGLTSTIVGYLPGHRPAALLVAKALGLGQASVQAVDPGNESVACPSTSSCSTQVVVTVGGDLASSSPSTSASTT